MGGKSFIHLNGSQSISYWLQALCHQVNGGEIRFVLTAIHIGGHTHGDRVPEINAAGGGQAVI